MTTIQRYKDLDLNFMPNPSAFERISGKGYLTYNSNSSVITGFDTQFTRYLKIDDNIYVSNSFIGKVKSIESDASLTLYSPALLSLMTDLYDSEYQQINNSTSSTNFLSFSVNGTDYQFDIANLSNNQIESGILRFDVTTDCPVIQNYPVNYKILGIDSYDVIGEYDRVEDMPVISDHLSGQLIFNEKPTGGYNAYVQIKTIVDNIVENIEHVIFSIQFADTTNHIMVSNANFTYSHPGDITFKLDDNAIKTSIEHLIRTINFERPFNSNIGSQTTNLLFNSSGPVYEQILKRSIAEIISSYEPRAKLTNIDISIQPDTDKNTANISIEFYIPMSNLPYTLNLSLERTR